MASAKATGSQWPRWMKPGIRVVRGPDWIQTVKDASVIDLGTLCYVPKQAADNKVNVVWDTGLERSYDSGFKGRYELRAYDIQQVGIIHIKTCSGCSKKPIYGIRYHCTECDDIDLCTKCYMADAHSLAHSFLRFDTDDSQQVNLPARKNSKKFQLKGVFEKAEVIRGPHWNYPNTDGSDANKGTVKAFIAMKEDVSNGWVRVKWNIGNEVEEYRLGAGGYVDVVASRTSSGGNVYVDHLPLVGIIKLKNGDKVTVNMDLSSFKEAQIKANVPDGWTNDMKKCIMETGTIQELFYNGEMARVQYEEGNMFVIVTLALYRKYGFQRGGVVEVVKDRKKLRKLQEGHGGYSTDMNQLLGRVGRILSIQDDGDMLILVGSDKFILSPAVCEPVNDPKVASKAPPMPVSDYEEDERDGSSTNDPPYASLLPPEGNCVPGRTLRDKNNEVKQQLNVFSQRMGSYVTSVMKNTNTDSGKKMFEALNQADLKSVQSFVERNNDLVNYKMEGRTILHIACHEGYKSIVSFLINHGASIEDTDDEGDTPLHYAAFGKQPDCLQELLQKNANPNVQNSSGITPLIIAVNHPCVDSVQCLILSDANVSLINSEGDTAMHDAIEQKEGQPMLSTVVLRSPTAKFTIVNSKTFNVLLWATFKGNKEAVKMMLEKDTSIVDSTLEGGFTALHVAAAKDSVEITSLLLYLGNANPNSKDSEGRTPLHISVDEAHIRIIEVLLDKKADINAQDKAGDTPLHYSQKKPYLSKTRRTTHDPDFNIHIMHFLLEKGADIHKKNNKGLTPVDLVLDMKVKIERLTTNYKAAPAKSQRGLNLPIHWTQMNGADMKMINLDVKDMMQKPEFQKVEKQFVNTLAQSKIETIQRIQNPLLWEHYTLKKRELEKKYGQGCANELQLYHGTKHRLVELIANGNFDFRIAGSTSGALFGDGAYFATTAKYSDLYAQEDNGLKVMFLAKALVGKVCLGQQGMKRPPEVDHTDYKKGMYDAVVDDIKNPKMYCVFDNNQYYPEYLVKYR